MLAGALGGERNERGRRSRRRERLLSGRRGVSFIPCCRSRNVREEPSYLTAKVHSENRCNDPGEDGFVPAPG